MPDFAMCGDEQCPIKKECLRYRAIPAEVQCYAAFEMERRGPECKSFLAIRPGTPVRTMEMVKRANACLEVTQKVET